MPFTLDPPRRDCFSISDGSQECNDLISLSAADGPAFAQRRRAAYGGTVGPEGRLDAHLAKRGLSKPQVAETFPLHQAAAAHAATQMGHGRGRRVLTAVD